MKLVNTLCLRSLSFALVLSLIVSCSNKPNDQQIQDSVTSKLKTNPSMAGINTSVADGVVTLSGMCEGNDCSATAESIVKEVKGVQSVDNKVKKDESTDLTLRSSVQTIISKYEGVQADVAEGNIVLRGTINRDLLQPLMNELGALKPKKIDNQLAVK